VSLPEFTIIDVDFPAGVKAKTDQRPHVRLLADAVSALPGSRARRSS
jgi:hypothetical protein